MKKLFSCILILSLVLSAGGALADMSLFDVWQELTWDLPEHTSKDRLSRTNNGRWVEGSWVGEVTNSMMENCLDMPEGGDCEDMLTAWLLGTYHPEQPFLELLVDDIEHVDAQIESSEFYSLYYGLDEIMIAEFYILDVTLQTPYGDENYNMLCCVTMDFTGEQAAKYIVTYGDLDALGGVRGVATSNYLGNLTVVNCEEWVSLRAQPSTSAERMKKVPLYATVTDGYDVGNGFVYCQYAGTAGFILAEYLDLATW